MSTYICRVISEPEYHNGECRFDVKTDRKTYTVYSRDIQAIKDYIFVNREQIIIIEGKIEGKKIILNRARIKMSNF